jgi:hypothetical protein
MSRFLKDWLTSSNEDHDEKQKVVVQGGETPKEDFSDASNEQSGDADTAKPAVAELDAASDGAGEPKTKDQGHQKVTVSAEDTDYAEETPDTDKEAGEAEETAEGDTEEGEGTEEEEGAAEETTDAGAAEVEEVKEEVSEDEGTQDEPVEPAEGEVVAEAEAGEAEGEDVPAEGAAEEADTDSGEEDVPAAVEGEDEETVPATGEESVEDNEPAPAEGDVPAADGDEVAEAKADAQGEDVETGDVNEGPTHDVPESEGEVSTEADESLDVGMTSPEDELVEEMDRVAKDGEHFEKISESLEAYHNLLSQALEDGDGITAATAESIRIGLEHMDESFGGDNVVMSMEAFGETSSKVIATRISLEGVGSALRKSIEVGKRILHKLFQLIYEGFTLLTNGVGKAKGRLAKVQERISALKDEKVSGEMRLKSVNALSIYGGFVGLDLKTLKHLMAVTDYMYVGYPKACAAFTKEYVKLIEKTTEANLSPGGDRNSVELAEQLLEQMSKLPAKHFSTVLGYGSQDKYEDKTVITSGTLPGNMALSTTFYHSGHIQRKEKNGMTTASFNLAKHMEVKFAGTGGAKPQKGSEIKEDIPTKRQMTAIAVELDLILKKLDNAHKAKSQYKEIEKTMAPAMSSVIDENFNAHINTFTGTGRVMTDPAGPFISYIGRTVNAYVTLLEYCVTMFEREAAA